MKEFKIGLKLERKKSPVYVNFRSKIELCAKILAQIMGKMPSKIVLHLSTEKKEGYERIKIEWDCLGRHGVLYDHFQFILFKSTGLWIQRHIDEEYLWFKLEEK